MGDTSLHEGSHNSVHAVSLYHNNISIYGPKSLLSLKMLLFLAIPSVLFVVNVRAIGDSPRPDYFHPLGGLTMQLESYVEEHGPTEGLEADLWFEQKLDHFTPSNTEVFSQRYAMNKAYYGNNSLAFLLISGDVAMIEHFIGYSFMGDEARKWRAATFMLEHRFYGKTIPKGNLEMGSLKYLSSEQALADVANFITQMNIQHGFENPKWIVFGWSYAGSLAAWMRYRYPHLVYAAVASSAPLTANADFSGYFQEVSKALTTVEPKCANPIRDAFSIMSAGMKNKTKRAHYAQLFNLCEPLEDNKNDIAHFFQTISYTFAYVVTYRNPEGMTEISIEGACEIMTDETTKCPVHRLANWFMKFHWSACWDHRYSTLLEHMKNTTAREYGNFRQLYYQTCTEFGWWHHTSSKKTDTFSDKISMDFYSNICKDAYDSRFNASFIDSAARETNIQYGGTSLDVSRVLFVHGTWDPWATLGITKEPPKGSIALFIKGSWHSTTGHCKDCLYWVCRCGFLLKSSVERLSGNRERVILKILVDPKDDNSRVLYYDDGTIMGPKSTVSPDISFFEPQLEERLKYTTRTQISYI